MNHICKNCKTKFQGNYCNNCGQSYNTHDLDFHFIWHDIKKGLFHYDNGIFYTAKELFTRPGTVSYTHLDVYKRQVLRFFIRLF